MLSIFILIINLLLVSACQDQNNTEREALLSFYQRVGGSSSYLGTCDSPWNSSLHYCHWCGVTCYVTCNVGALTLITTGLKGTISPSLGSLSELQIIQLQNNQLTGPIPPELGQLSNLILLTLNNNSLTGSIPSSFSQLANLSQLDLSDNNLSGSVDPQNFSTLTQLSILRMRNNNLFGSIIFPPNCALSTLDVSYSQINAISIPGCKYLQALLVRNSQVVTWEGDFPKLYIIDASNNNLGSTAFSLSSLCRYSNLQELHLSYNNLAGAVPECLGLLPSLGSLFLDHNQFNYLPTLNNVRVINMESNQLKGELGYQWYNLESGYFSDNKLSGNILLIGAVNLVLRNNNFTNYVLAPILAYLDVRDNPLFVPTTIYDAELVPDWSVITEEGCPTLIRTQPYLPLRMIVSPSYFGLKTCK